MSWLTWPFRLIGFAVWFAYAVVVANVSVLKDNLTPGQDSRPGVARVPTRCRTDLEVTLLASIITLTPGTLVIGNEAGTGRRAGTWVLYVHGMYADDADALREELTDMETRLLRAVRREGVPA